MENLSKYQKWQKACTFGAILLYNENKDLSPNNIKQVTEAAGIKINDDWINKFCELTSRNLIEKIIEGYSSVSAVAVTEAPKEEKKEEEKKEEVPEEKEDSDSEGGAGVGGLFGDDSDSD